MKRALLSTLVLAAAAASCSDATTNAPTQLNLDRPVDVAFACFGGLRTHDNTVITSAQPIASCNIRSGPRAAATDKPVPPDQEDRPGQPVPSAAWYAFILQSGPGTVAVARFETKPSSLIAPGDVTIQDADPLTPGKNSISVGEDPIAIATDKVGCKEVIANAGSCDLSILDVNTAINGVYTPTDREPAVARLEVKNGAGEPLRAKPAAMVIEPAGGDIGTTCGPDAQGLAYIAYPACHLVAGVDVSTGTIVTGVTLDTNGLPVAIDPATITCANECDGTVAPTPGTRPVALDLEKDERTGRALLAIGSDNSNIVLAYDVDNSSFQIISATSYTSVPLQNTNGRLGVTSLSISPVIGMGGSSGMIDDALQTAQHQFIYAVANDASVRVVDMGNPSGSVPVECDTQVDPRYIHEVRDVDLLSCFPNQKFLTSPATCTLDSDCGTNQFCLVDASATPAGTKRCSLTPPRRPGVRGPGIELINDAVPTSVDFFRSESPVTVNNDILRLIGYFAMISSAAGQTYVVNVDNDDMTTGADYVNPSFDSPDPAESQRLATQIPLVIAHQLRDAIPDRGATAQIVTDGVESFVCDNPGPDPDSNAGNSGGPRAAASPSRTVPPGILAPEKYGGLPSIRQVLCESPSGNAPVSELSFSAPLPVREAEFPDLKGLRSDEVWSLTWEGSLSLDKADSAVDGPAVRFGQMLVDTTGMHMVDQTRPFCDAGVEPYDVVQMRGCDPSIGDAGCPTGYTCFVHPQSQIAGLGACMLKDEAERLANACHDFLVSQRRYTIGKTKSGELQLLPRKHQLRTTPLDGCVDDAQCHTLATYALHNVNSTNPKDDTSAEDSHTWVCRKDGDRAPKPGTDKRCLLACDTDADCTVGTVCQPDPEAITKAGYCMEGVTPPQACVNAPQRYELHAGDAFAVVGSRQGYIHPIISDSSGNCIKDPNASPFQVGRIPLVAPDCDPAADPLTGRRPDGTYQPNPCKVTVDETEYMLNYVPGTCTLNDPDENLITRPSESIHFQNRAVNLTLVDPSYPGDAQCHGDRQGGLVNVPLVAAGFQIAFRLTAGFAPLALSIQPSFPIKVTRGPQESIWVVDQGDFLSTSVTTPSTRGKVYRVESSAIGVVNLLE